MEHQPGLPIFKRWIGYNTFIAFIRLVTFCVPYSHLFVLPIWFRPNLNTSPETQFWYLLDSSTSVYFHWYWWSGIYPWKSGSKVRSGMMISRRHILWVVHGKTRWRRSLRTLFATIPFSHNLRSCAAPACNKCNEIAVFGSTGVTRDHESPKQQWRA